MGNLRTFIQPKHYTRNTAHNTAFSVGVIIPSFKPSQVTFQLVSDISLWHPEYRIFLIDDSTPLDSFPEADQIFSSIRALRQVTLLRTPENKLKAGAINFGLKYIQNQKIPLDVIFTSDDDVTITPTTLPSMARTLLSAPGIGAVCSQSFVANRTKNFLTRLQALEYLGFNTARLADEGFFQGPLVMHGMLTAFRSSLLHELNGFNENCLIEDYEITVRIKNLGYDVAIAGLAPAWTAVPERFTQLWRQRVRWIYGGLTVIQNAKNLTPIIQDLLGHVLFLTTGLLILASLFLPVSHFGNGNADITSVLFLLIVSIAGLQLVIWYTFQLWIMRLYKEKDWKDWIIRILLVPEFLYANLMTLVLLGSYLFFIFNQVQAVFQKDGHAKNRVFHLGQRLFAKLGFTEKWGTRNLPKTT